VALKKRTVVLSLPVATGLSSLALQAFNTAAVASVSRTAVLRRDCNGTSRCETEPVGHQAPGVTGPRGCVAPGRTGAVAQVAVQRCASSANTSSACTAKSCRARPDRARPHTCPTVEAGTYGTPAPTFITAYSSRIAILMIGHQSNSEGLLEDR
jgi:hypothetical protein